MLLFAISIFKKINAEMHEAKKNTTTFSFAANYLRFLFYVSIYN